MASRKAWSKIRNRTVDFLFHAGRKSRIDFARATWPGLLDQATATEAALTVQIHQLNIGPHAEGYHIALHDLVENQKIERARIQDLQRRIHALDAEEQGFIATRNAKRQLLRDALRGLRVRGYVLIMEVADLVALEQIRIMENRTPVAFALARNPREAEAVDRIIEDLGLQRLRGGYLMVLHGGAYAEVPFQQHARYRFRFTPRVAEVHEHEDEDEHEDEHED